MNYLHVSLSPEAKDRLVGHRNASGKTLRESLISMLHAAGITTRTNPSLFSTTIEVDDDVPAIIGAVAILTNRSVEELIEKWLLEEPSPDNAQIESVVSPVSNKQLETVLGKVAEVLDLGETLMEQGIHHTQQLQNCGVDEWESVARANAEMFRALRLLLGLSEPHTATSE